jgi:putative adhesin
MHSTLLSLKTFAAAALVFAAGAAYAEVTDTRTLQDTVRVPGNGPPTVIVRNVFGSIRVTAHDRDTVEMTATETVSGDLQADITRARAEVELRTESEEGRVAFRVKRVGSPDGECNCNDNRWNWGWDGYRVAYDIDVRVPRDAAIEIATVNDGEVTGEGVRGDFDVRNVNGGIRLTGLRGSGSITTVNGAVSAAFERAPAAATTFKTVNGKIEVTFPQDLAADLKLKTMHGQIYTDFDTQPIAAEPVSERSRDGGKLVIRAERASTIRVGRGGPAYSFETLNGSVYVRKAAQ